MFSIESAWNTNSQQDELVDKLFGGKPENVEQSSKQILKKKKEKTAINKTERLNGSCKIDDIDIDEKENGPERKDVEVSNKKRKNKRKRKIEEVEEKTVETYTKEVTKGEKEDSTHSETKKKKKKEKSKITLSSENDILVDESLNKSKEGNETKNIELDEKKENEKTNDLPTDKKKRKRNRNKNKKLKNTEGKDHETKNEEDEIDEKTSQTQEESVKPKDDPLTKKLNQFQKKMNKKLEGGHFRWINEKLYTTDSSVAEEMFRKQPNLFDVYHKGFESQVEQWPENPIDVIIEYVKSRYFSCFSQFCLLTQ